MPLKDLRFSEKDAELLYSFPRTPSDLAAVIRCFMFINRAAAPTYSEMATCISKSIKAGILNRSDHQYIVNPEWYRKIHAFDELSENEIDSMITFTESLVDLQFHELVKGENELSQSEFDSAIRLLQRP